MTARPSARFSVSRRGHEQLRDFPTPRGAPPDDRKADVAKLDKLVGPKR